MLARLIVILALLLAQRAGLAHELWHLQPEAGEPAQQTLCDFHDVLGAVLGGADAPANAPALAQLGDAPAFRSSRTHFQAERRLRGARDPPYSVPK